MKITEIVTLMEESGGLVDFWLILGFYWWKRIQEAWDVAKAGFPSNGSAIVGGLSGCVYRIAVAFFLAVLLYDGFSWRLQRNAWITGALVVLYALSHLK